jgi:hypothetical protein
VWKQNGNIWLWRYTLNERNYPGWNLTADDSGCGSLLALLDELVERPGEYHTVQTLSPGRDQLAVPNNRIERATWLAPARLRLTYSKNSTAWEFPGDLEPATFEIGADWLPALREGISGIPHGRGDNSIGLNKGGNLTLTFWWGLRQ